MQKKLISFELDEQATAELERIAEELNIPVNEVLSKGLQMMKLYTELQRSQKGALVLRNHTDNTEHLLVLV